MQLRRFLVPCVMPLFLAFNACGDDAPATTDTTPDTTTDTTADTDDTTSNDVPGDDTSPPDIAVDTTPDTVDPGTWPWPLGPVEVPADASWRAGFSYPSDPFAVVDYSEVPQPAWLKFTVPTADPTLLIVQDANAYKFHYDFARERLPFLAVASPADFERKTLRHADKRAILGGILFAPEVWAEGGVNLGVREIGVQLVATDALSTDVALTVLRLVRDRLTTSDEGAPPTIFYMPTFEQEAVARASEEAFVNAGFPLATPARWVRGNVCYSAGWAIGRLVEVAPDRIDAAFAAGELLPSDILVTSAVPAEIPPLAGIVSFGPSTPLSHVALLANNFNIPFVYAADSATREVITGRLGQRVALRARRSGWGTFSFANCRVDAIPVDGFQGALEPSEIEAILDMKRPPVLELPPLTEAGRIAGPTTNLTSADIRHVGGKAANFGILERTLPNNVPTPSIAFTSDLFQRFLDVTPTGWDKPLRNLIAERLTGFSWPPADMNALRIALAGVRSLVEGTATRFAEAEREAILAALAPFEPTTRIRFRSSTNVEDSEFFTGAGLYESFSGCLADDLDDDEVGPSRCDPTQSNERGVFRAIKKVYASFWYDNAYFERLRHRVDESRAFMGLLSHYSYPDENELANGVATVVVQSGARNYVITTQKGAESVTNPTGSATPEVVSANIYQFGSWKEVQQRSSRVLLGETVMVWEKDYDDLLALLEAVTSAWGVGLPSGARYSLDFEFKKVVGGKLEVKQVRPIPLPPTDATTTAWLLPTPEPARRCILQGENSTVLGLHRAKSMLSLAYRGQRLGSRDVSAPFWTRWDVAAVFEGQRAGFDGDPTTFAEAWYELPDVSEPWGGTATSGFDWTPAGPTGAHVAWALGTQLPWRVSATEVPLVTLDDGWMTVMLTFERALFDPDYWDGGMTAEATAVLGPCPDDEVLTPAHTLRELELVGPNGLVFDIHFWWPPPPTGAVAGYTAPLAKWERTRILGLTTEPLELRGYWSQTYRPGHHNFTEAFVFEPRLEEGIDPAQLAELAALDITALRVESSWDVPTIHAQGVNGKWRQLQGPAPR